MSDDSWRRIEVDLDGLIRHLEAEVAEQLAMLAALRQAPAALADAIARNYLATKSAKSTAMHLRELGIRRSATAWYSPKDVLDVVLQSPDIPEAIRTMVDRLYGKNFNAVARAYG